jgi:hypothetical protein
MHYYLKRFAGKVSRTGMSTDRALIADELSTALRYFELLMVKVVLLLF